MKNIYLQTRIYWFIIWYGITKYNKVSLSLTKYFLFYKHIVKYRKQVDLELVQLFIWPGRPNFVVLLGLMILTGY